MVKASGPSSPEAGTFGRATKAVKDLRAWHERYSTQHPDADLETEDTILYGLPREVELGEVSLLAGKQDRMTISGIIEVTNPGKSSTLSLIVGCEHKPLDAAQEGMNIFIEYFITVNPAGEAVEAGRILDPYGRRVIEQTDNKAEEAVQNFTRCVEILEGLEDNGGVAASEIGVDNGDV